MTKFFLGLCAASLLPCAALAQTPKVNFTQFADPTENAFAVNVPVGWTVTGGIERVSPVVIQQWVTATSPDGTLQIFIGGPEVIPGFRVPGPGQSEGDQVASPSPELPPAVVLNYRAGADFATYYAPMRLAAAGCTAAAPTGDTQPMPDYAQAQAARSVQLLSGVATRYTYTPPPHEAGLATFTCQENGQTMDAAILADTTPPSAAGSWGVSGVAGYIAAPGQDTLALAILKYTLSSEQWNPQWDQAMREKLEAALTRQYQYDDAAMAQLQNMEQQSADFSRMLFAQGAAEQDAMHNAQMSQLNAQSAQENSNFEQYEAQRSLNSWNFDAHVRNGALYWDNDNQEYFEVDH
jgi:hypothetical protein